jgi:hypothetical protein
MATRKKAKKMVKAPAKKKRSATCSRCGKAGHNTRSHGPGKRFGMSRRPGARLA